MLIKFIVLSGVSFHCMANKYTPKKASNSDLRSHSVILSIVEVIKTKKINIVLQKSAANHYFISMKTQKSEPVYKISYKSAQEIDEKFVAAFIDVKYMS